MKKIDTEEFYKARIKTLEFDKETTKREIEGLRQNLEASKKAKGMEKWLNYSFESSAMHTDEFIAFAKDFKKYLLKQIRNDFELIGWSKGHFEVSGFLKNRKNKKFVYFSISDVRHFPDAWYNTLLIRTAKDKKDYTGGSNDYCKFPIIKEKALTLTK